MLEHCNRTYSLGLVNFEIKNIGEVILNKQHFDFTFKAYLLIFKYFLSLCVTAEDAFIKVGKLLQSRRKADLYETVTHYTGDGLDPAKTDPTLAAKLNENLKNHKKISDILEKFARKQDMPEEEEEEDKADQTTNSKEEEVKPSTSHNAIDTKESITTTTTTTTDSNSAVVDEDKVVVKLEESKTETDKTKNETVNDEVIVEDEYDEEDEEDDEDDEDEVNLDEQVETLANGDVSDNESDIEIIMSPKESIKSSKGASGHNKNIVDNVLNEKNNDEMENNVISLNTSSESVTITNCLDKENNSSIIQINSESDDSIYVNNNNNNHLDISITTTTTTKTVINTPITIDKDKSLIPSSSPPPTLLNPLATTPNGRLKDNMPSHQRLNSNNSTTASKSLIVCPNVNVSLAATTTTTADLKIVHVSSLGPSEDNDDVVVGVGDNNDDVLMSDSKRNKDVRNVCAELTTASSASKSLEEIVISDEES